MIYINQMVIFLLILSGLFVIISKNPVHSVLYLILSFISATLILLILKVEFIAMLFLVVYIGAITVLFLFVVMMLNIKIVELKEKVLRYFPIAISIIFIFLIEIIYLIRNNLITEKLEDKVFSTLSDLGFYQLIKINFYNLIDSFTNMEMLSFSLYTKFIYMFIIAGMILLVAMLGAIILTLNQNKENKLTQNFFFQINNTVKNSINLKNFLVFYCTKNTNNLNISYNKQPTLLKKNYE